ncbi:hypothetical protein [Cellulomonas composti]|uniref:Uncharacterized protein n=1 Tax=Cellulomonas composti TaxID=266130 RepID=A0A511JDV2_9CELL|nr:hypothetical protein [Cellulomonas composti]GEL96171.1 hypothetical protein CCO02nite_28290 [Cellulomonas composti]
MTATPVLVAAVAPDELARPLPPSTSALVATFPAATLEAARPGRLAVAVARRRVAALVVVLVGFAVLVALAALLAPGGWRVVAIVVVAVTALGGLRALQAVRARVTAWPRLEALGAAHVAVPARVTDVSSAQRQRRARPGDHAWVEVTTRDGRRWAGRVTLTRRLLPEQGDPAVVWHHQQDPAAAVVLLADASQP